MKYQDYFFDDELKGELPDSMLHNFLVDGEWYKLELQGGNWQLRNGHHFINLGFNNSYTATEVVAVLKKNILRSESGAK